MDIKPGSRWKSAVCDTEVIVVRAPTVPVTLSCGGVEMVGHAAERPAGAALDASMSTGTLLGKRYADEGAGIEVLCTKAGVGTLSIDGSPLPLKETKPLPSSD